MVIVNALQLEGRPTLRQSFWVVFGRNVYCAYTHTAIYASLRSKFWHRN